MKKSNLGISLITEDGKQVKYDKEFFICFTDNHPCFIGTSQERELYIVYSVIFHLGCGINTFGIKIFKKKKNAEKWCEQNKPS